MKVLFSQSVGDFESTWRLVCEQFDQRRDWIEELDAKLAGLEDTRVNRV